MKFTRMLLAFAVAAPLAAQQPDSAHRHGMMGHMEHMGGPMIRVMAFSPGHLLKHRDVLNLSDQQVAKLTTLRDAAKAAHDAARTEMHTHIQALTPLVSGANPDTAQLKPHFQALQAAMAKGHWAMLTAAMQARGLLTDAQRARADGWADAMEHMRSDGPGHRMMMRQGEDSSHD